MAEVQVILQGFNNVESHAEAIQELLSISDVQEAVLCLAFVRESGTRRYIDRIRDLGARCEIYVGVRNGITTAQSLKALVDTKATIYTVDGGNGRRIFHPKLYLSYNKLIARLIVGSANLTAGGLLDNIEASTVIELDRKLEGDEALLAKLLDGIRCIHTTVSGNVGHIVSRDHVDELFRRGWVLDETAQPQPKLSARSEEDNASVPPFPVFGTRFRNLEKSKLDRRTPNADKSLYRGFWTVFQRVAGEVTDLYDGCEFNIGDTISRNTVFAGIRFNVVLKMSSIRTELVIERPQGRAGENIRIWTDLAALSQDSYDPIRDSLSWEINRRGDVGYVRIWEKLELQYEVEHNLLDRCMSTFDSVNKLRDYLLPLLGRLGIDEKGLQA